MKGLFHVASHGARVGSGFRKYTDMTACREIEKTDLETKSIPEYQSTFNTGSRNFLVLADMSSINIKNVAEKIAEL